MLSGKVQQVISETNKYPYIVRVGVFGSYARNEETSASDIDILLEYDDSSEEYLDNLDDFMEDIEAVYSGKIDYVTMRGLMDSDDERFRQNVLRDVKWIYDSKSDPVL